MTDVERQPLFEGWTDYVGSEPVGMGFIDCFSLLLPSYCAPTRRSVTLRREGGRCAFETLPRPVEGMERWTRCVDVDLLYRFTTGVRSLLGREDPKLLDRFEACCAQRRERNFGKIDNDEDATAFTARAWLEMEKAREAIEPFVATLDARAVAACRDLRWDTLETGEYESLDRSFMPGAPLGQAFAWQPHLRYTYVALRRRDPTSFDEAVTAGRESFVRWVCAEPALPVLVGAGWPRAPGSRDTLGPTWRVAETMSAMDLGDRKAFERSVQDVHTFGDVAANAGAALCRLPDPWFPKGTSRMLAFGECLRAVEFVIVSLGPEADAGIARAVAAKGDWEALRARMLGHVDDGVELGDAWRDVQDMARFYSNQVVSPALALALADAMREGGGVDLSDMVPHAPAGPPRELEGRAPAHAPARDKRAKPDDVIRMLLGTGTVMRLLERSRKWHHAQATMALAMPKADAVPTSWPAALPDLDLGDIRIAVLTDDASLIAEGGRDGGLRHCVGGYGSRCLSGKCRILSIQVSVAGVWSRLSTAELVRDRGTFAAIQHRGAGNAAPPPLAVDALRRYLDHVGAHPELVDLDGMRPVPGGDELTRRAGYDARSREQWDIVSGLWAPLVPRHLREASPAAIAGFAHAKPGGMVDRTGWLGLGR